MPKTVEQILAELRAIVDAAADRDLTDDEATAYERLEQELAVARRTDQIRNRQGAYDTPVPADLAAVVHAGHGGKDGNEDLNKAFNAYLRTGQPNQDLTGLRNAQETGTDSEGGFLVSPQFRQKLVEVRKDFGGLAAEVESFSTERGGSLEYPSLDDTANEGAITAEEATFADGDDLVFGTINLGAFKYTSTGAGSGLPLRISVELAQDSEFDLAGLVARALGTRIARKQARDWVTGGGTTLPFGIAHAGLTPDHTLGGIDTWTYADLLAIEEALDSAYETNARWAFSKSVWSAIRQIEDSANRPLILDFTETIGDRPQKMLLGYPITIDQAFPTGASAKLAVLGDLRESYVIRRVSNLAIVVDPFTRAVNGQIQYVAWERADGNIQNRKAYSLAANPAT